MLKTNEPGILEINKQLLKEILVTNGISKTEEQKPIIDKAIKLMEFKHFRLSKEQLNIILEFVKGEK